MPRPLHFFILLSVVVACAVIYINIHELHFSSCRFYSTHTFCNSSCGKSTTGKEKTTMPKEEAPTLKEQAPLSLAMNQEIAKKLVLLAKDVYKSKRYIRSGKANTLILQAQFKLEELLTMVNMESPAIENEDSAVTSEQVVCPEIFNGYKAGYPFYQKKGWDLVPCTNVPPLNKVITILLIFKNKDNFTILRRVLKGISMFYPGLHVYVATDSNLPSDLGGDALNLTLKYFSSEGKTPGVVWNTMTKDASTPYVLIGRDLERVTWDIRLERQIRVAHNFGIGVVGGAVRTPDGHWSIGCRQLSLKNYTLAYIEGYDMSRNSCLYCEHLNGPFVAKTSFMREFSFDEDLPHDVLFEDFFIRISKNDHISMGCPDTMYFVEETESRKELKETWLPLVRKWEVNRVHLYNKIVHAFTCPGVGISCSYSKGVAVPICCLESLSRGMNKIFEVCEKIGVIIESDTGSIMGSVKLGGILPWERDGDVCYVKREHEKILKAKEMFTSAGCSVSPSGGKYFGIGVPGWRIEMWGMNYLTTENDLAENINRTRVYTDGYWQILPRNPGYFILSRYGHEVYKHAQSWVVLGGGHSWMAYSPGKFTPCPKPGHHACLDQFSGDGNIQFMGPWL